MQADRTGSSFLLSCHPDSDSPEMSVVAKLILLPALLALALPAFNAVVAEDDTSLSYSEEERSHWSFQSRLRPDVPVFEAAEDESWITNPIDAFILQKLNQAELKPSHAATKRTLIRRLCFNMTGLPPDPDDIDRFLADDSPDAWPQLVDRVLASPRYGEKWAQHWLDIVRFAETEGFEYDRHHAEAWRFRDYVIRCFNEDRPFDRFVTEHLAGDEIAARAGDVDPRVASDIRDALVAAGFHRLGPVRRNAGNPEIAFSRNEVLTEMANAVGTVFLGLTVGCARCHDHFYDPFRQKDYYQLQAFMAATHEYDAPYSDRAEYSAWKQQHDAITKQIYDIKQTIPNAAGEERDRLKARLLELQDELPQPVPTIFSVAADAKRRTPIHLLDRGDETRPGEELGLRFPGVFLPDGAEPLMANRDDPKTELARWITDDEHPLTARVIVNRVWQYHFGRGIQATANDFGVNGSRPTHPELLDWLANRFVASGWSIKTLHRLILTSSTWQQSSVKPGADNFETAMSVDPDNTLLWQFNRRRLTAEEIRDSLLSVSGALNPEFGGKSLMMPVDPELIKLLYKPAQWEVAERASDHNRRSIYLIFKRNLRLPFLEVFDQPDLQSSCARRESSTHSPQALELLNGPFSNRLADAFAARLEYETDRNPHAIADRAFRLATGRPPSQPERAAVVRFLADQPLREFTLAVFNMNAVLYVE